MSKKFNFGFTTDTLFRLQEVQEILREEEIFASVPSRPTLVGLIEDGTLEGIRTSMGYMIYRSSFVAWVRSFQRQFQIKAIGKHNRPKLRAVANS